MVFQRRLELLAIIAVVAFCALFLYTSAYLGGEFAGSDTKGSSQIAQLTGKPVEAFQPLIPQWVPPSSEIESALFALQAAVGGIVVGWVFGYWRALGKAPAQPTITESTLPAKPE
jgi:cobalt/nickel transport protein